MPPREPVELGSAELCVIVEGARPDAVVPIEREPVRGTPPPCVEDSVLPVRPPSAYEAGPVLPSETPPLLYVPRVVDEPILMLAQVLERVPSSSPESSP